jgi:hypothetical protein
MQEIFNVPPLQLSHTLGIMDGPNQHTFQWKWFRAQGFLDIVQ